jgi:transposase InsO family protein
VRRSREPGRDHWGTPQSATGEIAGGPWAIIGSPRQLPSSIYGSRPRNEHLSITSPQNAAVNPFVESFNGRVRDELLNVEEFATLIEAQVLTEAWRVEYNTYRPHSSLGGLTSAQYSERWTINQPALP